ncbi:MAG TPA: hypothetical protein VF173_25655 [Thermoanaerobaculia bacterium]|nr:hypothetical protein [Thermoanaerobaculia bacterium]
MDQELLTFLEDRFREASQQVEALREENTQQIGSLRKETSQQVKSLREEFTEQFASLTQQLASFRQETTQKFASLEDKVHLNQVALEGLRDDVRQVADGVAGVSERLDAFRGETALELKGVHRRLSILEAHAESKGRESLKAIREREDNRPL